MQGPNSPPRTLPPPAIREIPFGFIVFGCRFPGEGVEPARLRKTRCLIDAPPHHLTRALEEDRAWRGNHLGLTSPENGPGLWRQLPPRGRGCLGACEACQRHRGCERRGSSNSNNTLLPANIDKALPTSWGARETWLCPQRFGIEILTVWTYSPWAMFPFSRACVCAKNS